MNGLNGLIISPDVLRRHCGRTPSVKAVCLLEEGLQMMRVLREKGSHVLRQFRQKMQAKEAGSLRMRIREVADQGVPEVGRFVVPDGS